MKRLNFLLILVSLGIWIGCSSPTVQLGNYSKEVELYKPQFIDFLVKEHFTNPFDQAEIKVDALIKSPEGDTLVLPCFYKNGKSGDSKWQARFTPRKEGNYTFTLKLTTKEGSSESSVAEFTVKPSKDKGLLSADTKNPWRLKFDNGEAFRGVGMNIGWEFEPKWNTTQKYTFTGLLDEMQSNNANFYRMWICPWNMPIEWTAVSTYPTLTEEFMDYSNVAEHSEGFAISEGKTPVTQTDVNQLLKTSAEDQYLVYKFDSIRALKLML